MVRVFALCLSLALIVFGVVGVTLGAALWLVVLDFVAGAVGLGLDALLWTTQGRWSVLVAFAMSTALVVLFFIAVVAGASPWLSWAIFGVGAAFFAVGSARAFSRSLYGGELHV
mgnify:FL=1